MHEDRGDAAIAAPSVRRRVRAAAAAALAVLAAEARAQDLLAPAGPGDAIMHETAAECDVCPELAREIARLKADIAGIERLMRWQDDLTRTARTDRAEAMRLRLPMADCLASALAPLCDELTGLFQPEDDEGDAPAPAHEGEGLK
ncbi:MAG: hypothetical protein F4213_13290 [Boseongicola sp. SB0677_bin_26]|nr:hypothetical protein [Boseongicola sp. SB0677_bin_26]